METLIAFHTNHLLNTNTSNFSSTLSTSSSISSSSSSSSSSASASSLSCESPPSTLLKKTIIYQNSISLGYISDNEETLEHKTINDSSLFEKNTCNNNFKEEDTTAKESSILPCLVNTNLANDDDQTFHKMTTNNINNNKETTTTISWTKSLSNSINFLRKKSIFKSDSSIKLNTSENSNSNLSFNESISINNHQGNNNNIKSSIQMGLFDNKNIFKTNSELVAKSPWDILCQIINCKVAFKKQFNGKKYNWIQLAGHAGRFKPGDREGFILKLMDESERKCMDSLQKDILSPFVPKIDKIILDKDDKKYYIEMQDLLYGFQNPSIMDVKIGVRTFLENEQDDKETKPRNDLYKKLAEIAPNDLTPDEHIIKAITKKRYMQWRENSSSSSTLGFRIEAIKKNQVSEKEFFSVREKSNVLAYFKHYTDNKKRIMKMYVKRLEELLETLRISSFFAAHEMIGSSLLFVHDEKKANIWIIDFGKTRPLPPGLKITHNDKWIDGNHEDGYLIGINNLISIFKEAINS